MWKRLSSSMALGASTLSPAWLYRRISKERLCCGSLNARKKLLPLLNAKAGAWRSITTLPLKPGSSGV
ncbi:hypothetical protein D9M68_950430 [compost metagenome]